MAVWIQYGIQEDILYYGSVVGEVFYESAYFGFFKIIGNVAVQEDIIVEVQWSLLSQVSQIFCQLLEYTRAWCLSLCPCYTKYICTSICNMDETELSIVETPSKIVIY